MTRTRGFLRRAALAGGIVPALALGAAPVRADVQVIEKVSGVCRYSVGTVEGAALAVPPGARQTGIVCRVYENGVQIGGCGGALEASLAVCSGPVVGVGAPVVCTHAWAVFPRATVYDDYCE